MSILMLLAFLLALAAIGLLLTSVQRLEPTAVPPLDDATSRFEVRWERVAAAVALGAAAFGLGFLHFIATINIGGG